MSGVGERRGRSSSSRGEFRRFGELATVDTPWRSREYSLERARRDSDLSRELCRRLRANLSLPLGELLRDVESEDEPLRRCRLGDRRRLLAFDLFDLLRLEELLVPDGERRCD